MLTLADPTALALSRWQFAITAAFHMAFPALTVGLAVFLATVFTVYARTGDRLYLQIFRFWKKIFAVGFGLGVVAGTVMTFEFGLNWGGYAHAVGPILGVTIGMEVITAFFLEAGFIGVMLYGDGRVSTRAMSFACWMVALGTLLSTTWILSANSWMQHPVGYRVVDGQFRATDWEQVLLNPAFAYRFPHMLLAVMISTSWLLAGVAAWYLRRDRALPFARRTLSVGLGVAAILMPIQFYVGDGTTGFMAQNQLSKVEAVEGNWTSTNTGYNLIVVPDIEEGRNLFSISVPYLGSLFSKDPTGRTPTPGLLMTPKDQRPNMWPAFYGFRVMYLTAILMFGAAFAGVVLRVRGTLFTARRFHRLLVWMTPAGVVAVVAGWVTSETGRQPWVVWGQIRTADALSGLSVPEAAFSLVGFVGIYAALLALWIRYVVRCVRAGPEGLEIDQEARPVALSGAGNPGGGSDG